MSQRKYFKTISEEIFNDQKEYVYFARSKFYLNDHDAKILFSDTVFSIIENPREIPENMSLKNYVKRRMGWIFKDNLKKEKRSSTILGQTKYNYTDKDDDFLEAEPQRIKKYLTLKEDSIKSNKNDRSLIYLSTKEPHKITQGTAIFLSGLNGLSERTTERLRNKWGDEILVEEVIDENTLSIKVWFDHEIDHLGCGGETAKINFKEKLPILTNETLSKKLSGNSEEEKRNLKIQIKKCLDKIKGRDKEILKLSLIPDKNLNNNQKPTTNRIAEILNMAPGTVGEIAIRVRQAFALCIQNNGMVIT